MREYKIKRGYHPDINTIVEEYFDVSADVSNGCSFEVEGIGKIEMKKEKKSLFIDIVPPKKVSGDYSIIKKWNNFLYDATGKTTKERKKDFGKVKKK
ncbi:MAG: DUF5611 family protein [Candidatus Thermoplasmatota archaeon]|nr:DUF5611 family protein [Candidatus Thermoplasmatota archaeon]